jgi:polyisoprenoid-binding protein YceI
MLMCATPAVAETLNFTLLTKYSQASFRSDAPLETFVGTSALEGIQGSLTLDPAKPQDAKGGVQVDMNRVTTGNDKRDADMRGKNYLDTDVAGNRWVTFEIKRVEIAGPLVPGKETPAKVHGVVTIKQKPVTRVADTSVMYVKLTPEQLEQQRRFGFSSDNIKVKATVTTSFTEHGMQIPELMFLKLANSILMTADLVFVRTP